jgi:hypothetical protein
MTIDDILSHYQNMMTFSSLYQIQKLKNKKNKNFRLKLNF